MNNQDIEKGLLLAIFILSQGPNVFKYGNVEIMVRCERPWKVLSAKREYQISSENTLMHQKRESRNRSTNMTQCYSSYSAKNSFVHLLIKHCTES